MSILTGANIAEAVRCGEIAIKPFDLSQVGPNSYDVRLAPTLLKIEVFEKLEDSAALYDTDWPIILDFKEPYEVKEITLPESGYVLEPGFCYLGVTKEWTHSPSHVPMLTGRSTVARYGVTVHQTAGFGDIGFGGHWTLEITVNQPIRVYPDMRIGQVYFETAYGLNEQYEGNYSNEYTDNPRPNQGRPNNI